MGTVNSFAPLVGPSPGTRRIVVCLDRSASSEVCLPYALSLARTFGNQLVLLHVVQSRGDYAGSPSTSALGWEIARQEAEAYLQRLARVASDAIGRPVETRLEQGHAAERIVDVARELGADLTVLGSHGEGGVTAWSLGSTAQQVLALARGSVFIVRSSAAPPGKITPRRLMLPLDGSLRTECVLPAAARIAGVYGAELLLVHVVQEPLPTAVLRDPETLRLAQELAGRIEVEAKQYLENLRRQLPHEVASVRTLVVRHANERQCLLELAEKEQVDLVVVSAHGAACSATRSFGSVTAHLLTHSGVPLLVLQDIPERDRPRAQNAEEELAPPLRASYPPGTV
jgi:nucleotide-binding universal stress UspA family protein